MSKLLPSFLIGFSTIALLACGGGGGSSSVATTSNPIQARMLASPVGAGSAQCTNGGTRIDAWLDSNANGIMDPGEVSTTQYICAAVTNDMLTAGVNALVKMVAEPAGANCANGGQKISVGLDANGNAVLDASEVTSDAYLCNGTAGASGSSGLTTLMTTNTLSIADPHCAYGGTQFQLGLDTNGDGVLDSSEVTSTSYACNGAPGPAGPGVSWVDVTSTLVQAAPNTGYMADSTLQVAVTLPPSASLKKGDLVQVSGMGSGGWKVVQNADQNIATQVLGASGMVWTQTSAPTASRVASSADGTHLATALLGGGINTSADSGGTWTKTTAPNAMWQSIASSADGIHLVAVADPGGIYISNNSGVTWTQALAPLAYWSSVASSSDGIHLVAVAYGGWGSNGGFVPNTGGVYTSIDSGGTWNQTSAPLANWTSVASSADGTHLVATVSPGNIYESVDSGGTWLLTMAPSTYWTSIASSYDGTHLIASVSGPGGGIYTSINGGGGPWTQALAPTTHWASVASSSDGTHLVAVGLDIGIYTSVNSGSTWAQSKTTSSSWSAVASSSDGLHLLAADGNRGIYTSALHTSPGTTGSISGSQFDAIDLQYVGNGTFMILNYAGNDLVVN